MLNEVRAALPNQGEPHPILESPLVVRIPGYDDGSATWQGGSVVADPTTGGAPFRAQLDDGRSAAFATPGQAAAWFAVVAADWQTAEPAPA